jgi:pimeloyl-ACP methyl ester carboxylesterase
MKKTIAFLLLTILFLQAFQSADAQTGQQKPAIDNPALWQIINRNLLAATKDSVVLDAAADVGLYLLKDQTFTPTTIEFDVRGENKMNESFVGIAFNLQNEQTYEAIYLRPFNFYNPDTIRRWRAVQYIYMPNHPWEKLRADHPGQYENRIVQAPNPDKWFHVKITLVEQEIKVFIDNKPQPSLVVKSLSAHRSGKIAFWVGNGARGSFANLVITSADGTAKVNYGNNPAAGHYAQVGSAKLYYEVYGKGKPVVLLHGGVYGYIDEFASLIDELVKTNQVICVATRGHGKSEIGHTPFTWQQRAEDAYQVIKKITKEKVTVLGFSDGGAAAYKLAALHPELVQKLVAIGYGNRPKGDERVKFNYTPQLLMGQAAGLFEGRKALMPEPDRWGQCLEWLNKLYNEEALSKETFSRIKCPTLIMTGEKDEYHTVANVTEASKMIPGSRLSVIAGCGHVVFFCDFAAVWQSISSFLAS